MKKMLQIAFSLLMTLMLAAGMCVSSVAGDAAINLTYKGEAGGGFEFKPGSGYTSTDLFDNFKNVMPGDELEQKVVFTNNDTQHDYVNLYMRAVPHGEENAPQAQVSAERINEVLSTEPSIKGGSVDKSAEEGTVEFRNVSFRYKGSPEDELSDVNFRVEKGKTLAIIGATGSGKTTLVNLIPRTYDATQGEVLVDGVNVKEYTEKALLDKIGFVTQKATLFSGTVKDNVFFGESGAEYNDADLNESLEVSQADEFVDKLPEKSGYKIAQLGRNVSGGQKQRLSIARALARKPEILVFDDSFSALDYRTDAQLRKELNEKYEGVTKIIVAQRVGTIRHADEILVLERGEIVGRGTHDELMKNCEIYREIAASQLDSQEEEKRV